MPAAKNTEKNICSLSHLTHKKIIEKIMDLYDQQVQRVGPQRVIQAVTASKAGDILALAKVGIRSATAWDRAVLSFRSKVMIARQARKDEAAQHKRRTGY